MEYNNYMSTVTQNQGYNVLQVSRLSNEIGGSPSNGHDPHKIPKTQQFFICLSVCEAGGSGREELKR